jgi:hypothetical protein
MSEEKELETGIDILSVILENCAALSRAVYPGSPNR